MIFSNFYSILHSTESNLKKRPNEWKDREDWGQWKTMESSGKVVERRINQQTIGANVLSSQNSYLSIFLFNSWVNFSLFGRRIQRQSNSSANGEPLPERWRALSLLVVVADKQCITTSEAFIYDVCGVSAVVKQ